MIRFLRSVIICFLMITNVDSEFFIPEITLTVHTGWINSITKLSDGRIASGSYDRSIKIWNLTTQNAEITLTGHTSGINSIIQLSDGRIASGSDDRTIKIWNLTTQKAEITLTGHTFQITSIIQLSDGRIASGSYDRSIKIWNLTTQKAEITLTGHTFKITSIIQLSDGRIASASVDTSIKIWNKCKDSNNYMELCLEHSEESCSCSKCNSNYVLSSGYCVSIDYKNQECQKNNISNCKTSIFKKSSGSCSCTECNSYYVLSSGNCVSIDYKNQECQKGYLIFSCKTYIFDQSSNSCSCSECNSNYVLSSGDCVSIFSKNLECRTNKISNCETSIFDQNSNSCSCTKCDSNYILSSGYCFDSKSFECQKNDTISDCRYHSFNLNTNTCSCGQCNQNFYWIYNSCINKKDPNLLNCQKQNIPNCREKAYDKISKRCLCSNCDEDFFNINDSCSKLDFEKLRNCFYIQDRTVREIPDFNCITNLTQITRAGTKYCQLHSDMLLPKSIKNFFVFSQVNSPDYFYVGNMNYLKALDLIECKESRIFAYYFFNINCNNIDLNSLNSLLDKIQSYENISQKNLLLNNIIEAYINECSKEIDFLSSQKLKQLCISSQNNMVDFRKNKCLSNKACENQDFAKDLKSKANNTKCYLCEEEFFFVEKLSNCYTGIIRDDKYRDVWELVLMIIGGIIFIPISIFLLKLCRSGDEKDKEIYRYFMSLLLSIADIILDIAFMVSALYLYSSYKWINIGIFLLHPTIFYIIGIIMFLKFSKTAGFCTFFIQLVIFPLIFCIFNMLNLFASPNQFLKENELLEYFIGYDMKETSEWGPVNRKKYKLRMKLIDLICETIPELTWKIIINYSSDNWGYFQISTVIMTILNMIYCFYVILVEMMEIAKLKTDIKGRKVSEAPNEIEMINGALEVRI